MEEVESIERVLPHWKYEKAEEALISKDREEQVALWFSDGEIWTKNPSEGTLGQMLLIARHLGARVRGDESETYRTVAETYIHPDDADEYARSRKELESLSRGQRFKSILIPVIFGFFAGLVLLFKYLGWAK